MKNGVPASKLINLLQDKLQLEVHAGESGMERPLKTIHSGATDILLAGYLNLIHSHQIQVLGPQETTYLDNLGDNTRADTLKQIFSGNTVLVVVTNGQVIRPEWTGYANDSGIPLLGSPLDAKRVITDINEQLSMLLSKRETLHGVFIEVLGIRVLITGASNIGKSELALELVNRGHRLVADDAPEFRRISIDTLEGSCPEILQDLLEVRGLGVVNIRAMFGHYAVKYNKHLRLVIHMEEMELNHPAIERLHDEQLVSTILGVEIPRIVLPVAPGRNLAVLAETAVRNHILKTKGYNAYEDLVKRQREKMESPDQ